MKHNYYVRRNSADSACSSYHEHDWGDEDPADDEVFVGASVYHRLHVFGKLFVP